MNAGSVEEVSQSGVVIPPEERPSILVRAFRATRVWLVLCFGLVAWWVVVEAFTMPSYLLPGPDLVVRQFVDDPLKFINALKITAFESATGFLIAAVGAILLAVLMARSSLAEELLYPYLNIVRITPTVAIIPLLIIWFGHGLTPMIIVTVSIAFFPIVVGTVLGLKSVDTELIDLMRLLNASETKILRKIRFPNAVPHIFSSFRIAAPLAVIGALVGEFVGGSSGLGFQLTAAQAQLNTAAVFLLIVISSILGITFFKIVEFVESRLIRWHPAGRNGT